MYLSQNSNIQLAVGYSQLAIGYWRSLTYIYPFVGKYPSKGEKIKILHVFKPGNYIHREIILAPQAVHAWKRYSYLNEAELRLSRQ
jgi:hypothetical protein